MRVPMRVSVSTVLDCSPQAAWQEMLKPTHLAHVAFPMATIVPLRGERFPDRWREGATVVARCFLFFVIPTGERRLVFERVDAARRELQTRESDPLVKSWDHLASAHDAPGGRTLYTDTIDIDAGMLTPLVWGWASLFYRHRQRRWRAKAKLLAA